MKEYFKYKKGFVNIDDENLYLTNSGNWQEARNLQEKSSKTIRANKIKKNKFKLYFYILLGLGILSLFYQLSNGKSVRIPIVFCGLGFAVYRYMIRETGNAYKIPLQKIDSISLIETNVTIHFLDENSEETTEFISEVDSKGISLLQQHFSIT